MEEKRPFIGADFTPLPKEAEEIFEHFRPERTYKKGETIYRQGEQADSFYYVKKGQVKIFFNSPDGMEKTLSLVGKGSILGEAAFFDQMPRVSSAKTISPCTIIAINRSALLNAFRENPNLALHLLTLQAQSIRMLSSHVSSITFQRADRRIAGVLLQAKTKKNNQSVVTLTHEDIGYMVGVSRVTVSKILNDFAKRNLIKTAYRSVILTDIEALKEIAALD